MKALWSVFGVLIVGVVIVSVFTRPLETGKEARLLFVGDMMFDRTIRTRAFDTVDGYKALFDDVREYVSQFDMVVGNLEGPLTSQPSTSVGTVPGQEGNTSFTFSPVIADVLSRHNVRAVHIGNNHILDRGYQGFIETKQYLDQAEILYFGKPAQISATTTIHGIRIGLVSFNQFLGFGNPEETTTAIQHVRDTSDVVIVYTHWGDEYVGAQEYQKTWARLWIDAGADMVIGSHPHVIQEHEVYKDKHIYYSLGNFIFDQYWNDEVRTGLALEVYISKHGIRTQEQKTFLERTGKTKIVR